MDQSLGRHPRVRNALNGGKVRGAFAVRFRCVSSRTNWLTIRTICPLAAARIKSRAAPVDDKDAEKRTLESTKTLGMSIKTVDAIHLADKFVAPCPSAVDQLVKRHSLFP